MLGGDIQKITLTGSSTVAPLASELGKKFESLHPDVRVDVQSGGSSRGITDARQGLADIGMASRALKEDENDLFPFTVALDGVSVILNSQNPVKELTDSQIIDIFKGTITNWKQVGGKDARITVVNKAEGRSTLELFCQYFKLKNPEIKAQVIIGDNEQGIKTVAGNPNAIGYVSIGTAEYDATHGIKIKLLPVGGVAASLENVRNRSFPISRPLNYVTKTVPQGWIKKFIEFSQSKEAEEIIKAQYFVPIIKK
jgi:phosphate transport system substrate-binding protein